MWLFSITLFASAFLLFLIQLIVGKMVLPILGGTPAVWNTCMVFFQALLLAGYCYAHVTTAWWGVSRQAMLHAVLLLVPFCFLPIRQAPSWVPPVDTNPIFWLLGLLLRSVGPPFVVVATTAPLLQKWFAQTSHAAAKDPYFLYAASNLGSLLALVGYPLLIAPHLRLGDQSRLWAVGYGLLVVLLLGCAVFVRHSSAPASSPADSSGKVTVARRLRWVLLAFIPSSLMSGITTYLSTDLAPVPLLWVIPLGLYLLTFVFVFARRRLIPHAWMVRAFPVVILPLIIAIASHKNTPLWWLMPLHLLVFFVAAMVCHGELAKDRPPTAFLTEFYLWMSVGGVLGGVFNAILAPQIFDVVFEYPLAIVFAALMRPSATPDHGYPRTHWLDYALPIALGGLVVSVSLAESVGWGGPEIMRRLLLYGPPALACYVFRYRPVRFGLGIGAFLFAGMFTAAGWERTLQMDRSFFGVYRITREDGPGGGYHRLEHGTTLQGMQSLDPHRRREPLTYYHPTGPLGQVFKHFAAATPRLRRVGVIGLGTGTMACYASPGQAWTFYEIDPLIRRLATDRRYFTYLRDCLETYAIVMGDARLSLAHAPDASYDLLIVDAFSSDAIPIHLLTREALRLYFAKVAEGGLLAFHISNRYLRLAPVLAAIAQQNGLSGVQGRDLHLSQAQQHQGKSASHWVILAQRPEDLDPLTREDTRWRPLNTQPGVKAWTDDFSDLLSVLRWR